METRNRRQRSGEGRDERVLAAARCSGAADAHAETLGEAERNPISTRW